MWLIKFNYNSFFMSFIEYSPAGSSFYQGSALAQNILVPQISYQYSPEELQYQMMRMHEHNAFLQYQYLQQSYQQMLQQQQNWKQIQNLVKVQESIRNVNEVSERNPHEQTEKFFHQTEVVSKDILIKRASKIKKPKPQKNETKNIPKNYGKAIVSFIENNKEVVKAALSKHSDMSYVTFMNLLRVRKNKINSIADLRSFWLESQEQDFPKIVRILSNIFLRHFSLEYIFNSRISNYAGHVKYRARLIEALRDPECFTSIKQY